MKEVKRTNAALRLPVAWLLLILLGLMIMPVQARMYQWNDPDTGTTQMSGSPPPWYRSTTDGPRVFVFEKGQLVDDTGRKVSEQRRQFLREQAINQAVEAEEERHARALPPTRPEFMLLDPGTIPALLPPVPEAEPTEALAEGSETDQPVTDGLSAEEIRAMRALIEEWENRRQREAREILEANGASGNQP